MMDHDDRCPFLVPVMADQLWMYPLPAYCHRPDAPVKVPALETFFRVCLSPEHARCPGFRTTVTRRDSVAD
jgi:hypothetical protein